MEAPRRDDVGELVVKKLADEEALALAAHPAGFLGHAGGVSEPGPPLLMSGRRNSGGSGHSGMCSSTRRRDGSSRSAGPEDFFVAEFSN